MHKLRASSYIRRTISEPFSRRRSVLCAGPSPFPKEATTPLITNNVFPVPYEEHYVQDYTWASDFIGLRAHILTKLNILLPLVPAGLIASYFKCSDFTVFWLNFLALIPLAALLGNVTEEVALHTGDLIGGLLNATFGNAVEMIITVQALRAGLIDVVKGTLLGSILSNLLLILGMSFFFGGLFHYVQKFNPQGPTCSTSLLLLACLGFIVPTISGSTLEETSSSNILTISRLTALLIALTYCLFIFFQLGTHFSLFKNNADIIAEESMYEDAYAEDLPSLSATTASVLLFAITCTVSISSEALVGSIDGLSENSGIPKSFIGVILLPLVGNAAEHATAVTVAIKNKPDLVMGVAIGSSTQIAMFMVPFSVLVGWAMGIPMSLALSKVSATVMTFSILIVIGVVQDGESNWFEGVMLMVAYFIIAIVYWYDKV